MHARVTPVSGAACQMWWMTPPYQATPTRNNQVLYVSNISPRNDTERTSQSPWLPQAWWSYRQSFFRKPTASSSRLRTARKTISGILALHADTCGTRSFPFASKTSLSGSDWSKVRSWSLPFTDYKDVVPSYFDMPGTCVSAQSPSMSSNLSLGTEYPVKYLSSTTSH